MKRQKPKPASVIVGPLRMDAELAARLKAHALADSRTIASVVRVAVKKYLDWIATGK